MKATLKRYCKLISGWTLVLLGVIGWFLPVVPGTVLIFLGVALLSAQSEWMRKRIEFLKARFPRHAAKLQALKESLTSKMRREGTS
ncbi:MAG: PGPGW domain-containing protein [Candidatus Binatia bacterium]